MEDIIIVNNITELSRKTTKKIWDSFNSVEKHIVMFNIQPHQLKLWMDYRIEIIDDKIYIKVLNKSKKYEEYMDLLRVIEEKLFYKIDDIVGWEIA